MRHLHSKTITADQNRLQIWHAAAEAAGRRPILGYGSDTFFSAYMPFRIPWSAPARYAHNLFVQQWVELGAAGVAALVGTLTFLLARPVARRTLWGREPGFWLLFGPVAIVLQNLVDITWFFPAIYLLFLFEAGVLSAWSLGAGDADGFPAPDCL
jgi:O-antigen ligase